MTKKKFPKTMLLGIDGGTWDLILPWVDQGRLPHFSMLLKEGAWGSLQSTLPPVTAPAWTSFLTGKNPGQHGLYDFFEIDPDTYGIQYSSASSRKAKTIWRILSDRGKRVGVVNVPMTYPPEQVNGFMISGMDTPDEDSPFIYPPSLKEEIWKEVGAIRLDIHHLGNMNSDRKREKVLRELIAQEKSRFKLILYLLEKHPVDVFMMVFNAIDQVQHHFWHYMDPRHFSLDEKGVKGFGTAIFRLYQCIDEIIGLLLKVLPAETTLMLMSDHGFGEASPRVFYINRYLEKIGVLSLKKEPKPLSRLFSNTMGKVDRFLRSNLSPDLKRKIAKCFPWARAQLESYLSFSMIDWAKTKAYAIEISPTSPTVWVNLKGRNREGMVPSHEYDGVVESVRKALYDLKDPTDGRPVVLKIYRKEEIYHGKELNKAPDLTLSWWEGKGFTVKPSYPRAPDQEDVIVEYPSGKMRGGQDWSGTHLPNGIFLFHGQEIKKGKRVEGTQIIDLAPTLLYLLQEAVPDDMDGRVVTEIFETSEKKLEPVEYQPISSDEDDERMSAYSEEDRLKIQKRLQDLGYLS
jgi:predicted AlkP superfamily phosphohydrolase/phosphomutase